MIRPRATTGRWVAGCVLLLVLLVGCARSAEPGGKLVVLGIDGLDLRMLDQMVAAGELPTFGRLYREGAVGHFSTGEAGPMPESPLIWTSVATGVLPAQHGITDFVYTDEAGKRRLFSSIQRKAPAAWEMASAAGKRVGVVNWWASYPAEAVNGFVVSARYREAWVLKAARFFESQVDRKRERLTYPPSLVKELDASVPQVRGAALDAASAEKLDHAVLETAYVASAKIPVDLLMIYTRALDELSHLHWDTHEPLPGEHPERDEIATYLRRWDGMLDELMGRLVGPDDHLMILSDHGFERAVDVPNVTGVHMSRSTAFGVLLLHGPRIRAGARIEGARLLDVLPTLLELAGVPPGRDLGGLVIKQALVGQQALLARVAPYTRAPQVAAGGEAIDVGDASEIERLKALGYIQ